MKIPRTSDEDEPIDEDRLADKLGSLKVNYLDYAKFTDKKYTYALLTV